MAAALAYFEDATPPKELKLAWKVKRWGVLPDVGGLNDQEVGLLERMAWAESTYKAVKEYSTASDLAAWIRTNKELHDLYDYAVDLLLEAGLV